MHLTNHVNEDNYNVSNQGGLYASGMKYHCDNILWAFASLYRWEWRKECGSCHIPNYQVGCQVTQLCFVNLSWKAKSKHTKERFIMYYSFPPKRVKGRIWCTLTMRRGGHLNDLNLNDFVVVLYSVIMPSVFFPGLCLWGGKPVCKIVWGNSTTMWPAGLHWLHSHVDCSGQFHDQRISKLFQWDRKSEPRGWVGTISNRCRVLDIHSNLEDKIPSEPTSARVCDAQSHDLTRNKRTADKSNEV